jgi:MoaD family protein
MLLVIYAIDSLLKENDRIHPGVTDNQNTPVLTREVELNVGVNVRYFATLRDITKKEGETLKFGREPSVSEILEELSKRYGASFDRFALDDKRALRRNLGVVVNGFGINSSEIKTTTIRNGDEFVILPPTAGG